MLSISTNLPPTAYIKMIDFWLIFNLLKPFIDIIVQTYIETLRDNPDDHKREEEEEEGDNEPSKEVWIDKKISPSPPMKDMKYRMTPLYILTRPQSFQSQGWKTPAGSDEDILQERV